MPEPRSEDPLVPSLLDRLLDFEPERKVDPPANRTQRLRELKESVRRDVENLLNSRQQFVEVPEDLTELETSLVNYGLPDFTGVSLTTEGSRKEFVQMVGDVIRRFEPRLRRIRVSPLDNTEPLDRTLRFRIEAMLLVEPAPEPVVFDSALEPSSGEFDVRGAS